MAVPLTQKCLAALETLYQWDNLQHQTAETVSFLVFLQGIL